MKIAYALAGEGRGHTTRALTLANGLLARGHEVAFFTCGDALELLRESFGHDAVYHLETPRFVIVRKRVSYVRTGLKGLGYLYGHRRRRNAAIKQLRDWGPDALITDFEPTFAGVARRLNVPLISFNSQRFSTDAKLNHLLNRRQRLKLLPIKIMCRVFAPRPALSLVSKGFNLEPKKPNTHLLGPMLRPEFTHDAWRPSGTHVIAYLRQSVLHHLPDLAAHAQSHGLPLKLYGHYPEDVPENVEVRPISNDGFIEDLVTADRIVQTAGTQLLGEGGCLGIPSLCFPEPAQVEQEINGVRAQKTFLNVEVVRPKATSIEQLDEVLRGLNTSEPRPIIRNGCEQAVEIIDSFLNQLSDRRLGVDAPYDRLTTAAVR